MKGNLTPRYFALILVAITLGGFGQIFIKKGIGNTPLTQPQFIDTIISIFFAMLRPYVLMGLSLYVISTFFWLMAISRVRLSVAYPLISMSYPLVVVLSSVMLHERVQWPYAAAGLVFITIGVSFIGLGLGQAKEETK